VVEVLDMEDEEEEEEEGAAMDIDAARKVCVRACVLWVCVRVCMFVDSSIEVDVADACEACRCVPRVRPMLPLGSLPSHLPL
jgi:hypothetical protein